MESHKPFRVVIVGCGLVGLMAAHIFSKAGIDFVILEKYDSPLSTRGTILAIWPQTFRIFAQLGLLEGVQSVLEVVETSYVISSGTGRVRMKDKILAMLGQNHGYRTQCAHRPHMVKFLYDSLPEDAKTRILTKKSVVDVSVSDEGVEAICDDGSTHQGSIVIGADGVRSKVRLIARALSAGTTPDELPEAQKTPYTISYRMYFSLTPVFRDLETDARYDSTHDGLTTQIINGQDRAWIGVYEKLEHPTTKSTRYTEADKKALVERWGHIIMAPGWTFRDVYARQEGETGFIDLEEGLVEQRYHKRIVLVGDAIRKLDPHAGLGFNNGVTDIVALANGLRRLLNEDKSPSTQSLEKVFEEYQTTRAKDTKDMLELSALLPRLLAWPTWKYRVVAKYALPYLPLSTYVTKKIMGPSVLAAPVIEWLDEGVLPPSKTPWKIFPAPKVKEKAG
ncbi:putative monooxygenase [Biscogniauxia mediterranea]|nr:putative monooxygenase [Biscogniauxia mediterranea]